MSRARTLADLFNTDGNLNLSPVETINSTALNGRRNLIINGQFQVWQRGTSITSNNSNKYTADRWHSGTNGSEDVFYTRQFTNTSDGTPFIRVRRSGTASGRMYLTQMMETSVLDFCRGKTVTLSFKARKHADFDATFVSRIATQTNQTPRDDSAVQNSEVTRTLTTSFQTFTQSLTLTSSSDSANGFRVEFIAEDGANSSNSYYYEVRDVQLEIGTVASEIENRSYGEELSLCKRYYQRWDATALDATSNKPIGAGVWYTSTQILAMFNYDEMRASPSFTASSTGFVKAYGGGFAEARTGGNGIDSIGTKAARFNFTCGARTAGHGAMIQMNANGDYLELDAEL